MKHETRSYAPGRHQTGTVFLYVLGAALVFGLLGGFLLAGGGRSLARQLDPEQRALYLDQQTALQPWKIAGAVTLRALGIVLEVAGAGAFLYALWIALSFLDRRARLVYPKDGLFPIVEARGDVTIYDPNRNAAGAVRIDKAGYAIPQMQPAQLYTTAGALKVQQAAALSSGGNISIKYDGGPAALDAPPETPGAILPARLSLKALLDDTPSLARLVLGVTVNDQTGQMETVTGNMGDLVHIAVGGSSGWGKSVFLRSLAYQMALAKERPDLVAIDLEGVTLSPLARSSRLLFPLADTEQDARAVLAALSEELERRKELFSRFPGVDNLAAYNARVAAWQPLPPVILLCDEVTALLDDKDIQAQLKNVTLRARKYGLWAVLAGQDWKASSLDSAIKNQLSTRVQFKALSGAQSRVLLGQGGAEELTDKGRALAILPGRDLLTMQAPYIGADTLLEAFTGSGPRAPMPAFVVKAPDTGLDPETIAQIRALHARGDSLRAIQEAVFGYQGGAAYRTVKDVLGGDTDTTDTETGRK